MTAVKTLRVARLGLSAIFAVDGMVFASWTSRLPQVKNLVHADNGALGMALLGTAAGAFVAMPLVGLLCRSRPPHVVALIAVSLLGASVLLPGLARSTGVLLLCLLLFGAAYGAVDVAMNSTAVQLAAQLRRPIVPTFHAAFSLGSIVGAAGGGIAAAAGTSVEIHMAIAAVITGLVVLIASLTLLPLRNADRESHVEVRDGRRDKVSPGIRDRLPLLAVACVLTFGTAFGEGAAANWAGIHLRQDAHVAAGLAPAAFAVFSLTQAAGRSIGTRLTERLGPHRLTRAGALLAAVGFTAALVPPFPVIMAGYLVAGLGVSCLFPLGIAHAGNTAGSVGVSLASTVGYAGFLLGPPLVGVLAQTTSLSLALSVPVALAVIVFFTAAKLPHVGPELRARTAVGSVEPDRIIR